MLTVIMGLLLKRNSTLYCNTELMENKGENSTNTVCADPPRLKNKEDWIIIRDRMRRTDGYGREHYALPER